MKLDLRKPTLVITGAWNPPIFQPAWVAEHLFQVPRGARLRANKVLELSASEARETFFIDDIGYRVHPLRFELFLNAFDQDTRTLAEQVCLRLLATVPHTPIQAMGINFFFEEEDPEDTLLDSLRVQDSLAAHYRILKQDLRAEIQFDEHCQLNIVRTPTPDGVLFNFNFHHASFEEAIRTDVLTGCIGKYLEQAETLLRDIYHLQEFELITFELTRDAYEQQEIQD